VAFQSSKFPCSNESLSVAVASSEESPVAMKLKKMWLKAPVSEDGDTNLGKRWLTSDIFYSFVYFACQLVIIILPFCIFLLVCKRSVLLIRT
jgi:hypothetical protein